MLMEIHNGSSTRKGTLPGNGGTLHSNNGSSVLSGKELHEDHQYRWLCACETDDLVLMQDELMEAIAQVSQGDDVEAVEDTIHEWYESAIAALSEVLDTAFKAESEPIELTPPPNDPETVEA